MSDEEPQQTLVSHLVELRDRLLKILLGLGVLFVVMFPFADELYSMLAGPLLRHLPEGSSMIAINVVAPFLIPLKMVLLTSIVLSIPWILYQIWGFVAPGLYQHEQKLVWPILVSSSALFYVGMVFAYFVVFPLAFGFFTSTGPEGMAVMPDIGLYLDLVFKLFIAFGAAFEVPVLTFILIRAGITTPEALAAKRSYVIVGAFVLGMLLTPPDVISQVLLALPVWLLFELGLIAGRWVQKPQAEDVIDEQRYRSMSDEEMEMELDEIELLEQAESEPREPEIKKPD